MSEGAAMRRILVLGGGLALMGTLLVGASGTAWANVPAQGTGGCKFVAGKGAVTPPITLGGSASVKKVTIKFTVSTWKDCSIFDTSPYTGNVTGITSIQATGTYKLATGFANSCANFQAGPAQDVPKVKVTTKWIASPAATNTHATYHSSTYQSPGIFQLGTPTNWTGSFSASAASGLIDLTTTMPDLTTCTGATTITSFGINGAYLNV
jgi:hypothetical protein